MNLASTIAFYGGHLVPESRKRKDAKPPRSQQPEELNKSWAADMKPSPRWWAPLSVALMLVGLLLVVVYYISSSAYPIPNAGNWNLALGLGVAFAGFLMLLRWK